jgi:predicted enzyme related to lactoylglutathione lyase
MFAFDDLDNTLDRLRKHGAQVVDEVVQYEDVYRLCYVRGSREYRWSQNSGREHRI